MAIAAVSVISGWIGDTAGGLVVLVRYADSGESTAGLEAWAEVFEGAEEIEPHLDEVSDFVTTIQDARSEGLFATFEQATTIGRWVTVATHLFLSYLVACFTVRFSASSSGL